MLESSQAEASRLFSDAHTDAAFAITWQLLHPSFTELRPLTEEWIKLQQLFSSAESAG